MTSPPTDTTPAVRARAAAEALGPEALARWCAAVLSGAADPLQDSDPDPRWLAARAWTSWGDPSTWPDRGLDYWFRVWAARTLLHEWHPVGESAVRSGLADPHWRVREMCAKVVARQGLAAAADACARLADGDASVRVRIAALRGLATAGEHEHGAAVMRCLDDADRSVVAAAERTRTAMEARLDRRLGEEH